MFWIVLFACIAADQLTKALVMHSFVVGQSVPVLDGFFNLTYLLNTGAGFSMLQGHRWVFLVLTLAVLVLILIVRRYIPLSYRRFHVVLAVFCGGTMGNFIDRLVRGSVVDFLDFRYFPAIFNIADCCLTISTILLCYMLLFGKEKALIEGTKKRAYICRLAFGSEEWKEALSARQSAIRGSFIRTRRYGSQRRRYGHKRVYEPKDYIKNGGSLPCIVVRRDSPHAEEKENV